MAGIGPENGTTGGGVLALDASEWGGGVSTMQGNMASTVGTAGSGQVQKYYYYRLLSVTDRLGTKLLYQYQGSKDIVPKSIVVQGRPELAIHVNSVGGKINSVFDPMGNEISYEYNTNGNGTLVKVTSEGVPISRYGYKRWEETDYRQDVKRGGAGAGSGANLLPWASTVGSNPLEDPPQLFQYGEKVQHFDLESISDAENNTYTFHTEVDTSHTTMSVSNFAVPSGGGTSTLGGYLENGTLENGGPCVRRYPLSGFPPDVTSIDLPGGGSVRIGDSEDIPPVAGSQTQSIQLGQRHTTVRDAENNRRTYVWDKAITVAVDQEMMGYGQEISIGSPPRGLAESVLNIDDLEDEQPASTPSPTGSTTVHTYYTRMSICHDGGGLETYVFNFLAAGALASVTDFSGNTTKYGYGDQPGHPGSTIVLDTLPGGISPPLLSKPTSETNHLLQTTWFSYGHRGMMSQRFDRTGIDRDFGVDAKGRSTRETITTREGSGSTPILLGDTEIAYHSDSLSTGFPGFPIRRTIKKAGVFTSGDPSWVQPLTSLYKPDPNGRIEEESNDMNGTGEIDAGDLITKYKYDRNGNKVTATDPAGQSTWFHYDKRNRLVGVVFPDGTEKTTVYDKRGKKVLERDENGVATGYVYDARGRMIKSVRDMNGSLAYTSSGLTGIDPGIDLIEEKVYNKIGSVIQAKDVRGYVSVTKYDHLRRPIVSILPGTARLPGQVPTEASDDTTRFFYEREKNTGGSCFDVSGFKPTRIEDPRGYESIFTYDSLYRSEESRVQYSLSPPLYAKTENSYDPDTNVLLEVRKPGRPYDEHGYPVGTSFVGVTIFTSYDKLLRPVKVRETGMQSGSKASEITTDFTSTGLTRKVTRKLNDTETAVTDTVYDAAGRVEKVFAPEVFVNGIAPKVRPETSMIYGPSGLLIESKDAREGITSFFHDARGRQIQQLSPSVTDFDSGQTRSPRVTTDYDKAGNVIKATDPRGYVTAMEYDAAYRPVKVTAPTYLDNRTGLEVTPVTHTGYDAAGNPIKVTSPGGSVVINTYDARGRLVRTKTNPTVPATLAAHADDMVTNFSWDSAGNRTLVVDPAEQHTSFEYDGLNRLVATTWDSNDVSRKKTETSEHDALVLIARIDPRSIRTDYQYADRLFLTGSTCALVPGDNEIRNYDRAGRLLAVTRPSNASLNASYLYDSLDRVTHETSAGHTHQYGYDKSGNRTWLKYGKTNRVVDSVYDHLNRVITITDSTRVTGYKYDLAGNVRELRQGNGTIEVSAYDALGRRSSQKTSAGTGSTPVSWFDYDYDPVGNLARIREKYSSSTVPDRTVNNAYDRQNRLLTETTDTLTPSNTVSKSALTTYTYSKANNRILKNVKVTEGGVLTQDVDQNYTYGNAQNGKNSNQLDSYFDGATGEIVSFTYDLSGNRKTKSVDGDLKQTYEWDSLDRLISVADAETGHDYLYGYDHRTRRVIRDESGAGGENTLVCFSGGTSVFETVGTATQVEFIRGSDYGGGIGGIMYSLRGSTPVPRFNAYNGRGDVVAQTDAIGVVKWQATYEAFGTRTKEDGVNEDRQKANTKEEDPTGLLNEGFRYRDLVTGSFISRDPLGFVDGPNVYTYVRQNPWSAFDPEGLEEEKVSQPEWHHDVVDNNNNEMNKLAREAGYTSDDIDSKENGTILERDDHRIKDADGLHTTGPESSRETWEKAQQEAAEKWRIDNPGRNPTKADVGKLIEDLKKDERFVKQYSKGVKAEVSYKKWRKLAPEVKVAKFALLKSVAKRIPYLGAVVATGSATVSVAQGQDVGDAGMDVLLEATNADVAKGLIEGNGLTRKGQAVFNKEQEELQKALDDIDL